MSAIVAERHSRNRGRFTGLPTWSAIAVVAAALITGLLLSLALQGVGLPFLWCFVVASVIVTLLVNPRGLFLTVASLPLLFGLALPAASWAVERSLATEGTPLMSRTTALITVYPLTQYFPWLAITTALCAVIAVIRVVLLRRRTTQQERTARDQRERLDASNRRNRSLSTSARRRSEQLTVQELLERNQSRGR
ncbi:DUF6542 domain-containing protein [Corynebacterium doosanense]|uniref:Gamma-aminobutyrate permease n=1 Tax=Corynebacterium doosanense CAU 212 = DSM 45436 TaxID=558173 RepID=A0A097IEW9_9CORY|nr:DUF6542 domain-containing protein [Corynebacterium doosanense]AIT60668.1 gamma-aminobutyrate permease [Corynebacterium doosanense CAU 212 = DSM 45436]